MATVTDEIARLLRAKDQKLLDGQTAVKGLLTAVRGQILEELRSVTGESYAAYHLRQNLSSIERHLLQFESLAGRELESLIGASWDDGADLVLDVAKAGGLFTAFGIVPTSVLQTLRDTSIYRIKSLTDAAFDRVRGELTLGILGQKTPHQVVTAVAGSLDSPGVFKSIEERAETIVKLEMGRAFSTATISGMQQAAASVPGLQKQWWHAGHPKRPRQSHLALHGQLQPVDKKFLVGSLAIDYPRAPDAPLGEVINCGCDVAPWHPAWGERDGKMIELPIRNERGETIARRGPRTGFEDSLAGRFKLGQAGKGPKNG